MTLVPKHDRATSDKQLRMDNRQFEELLERIEISIAVEQRVMFA
jgi:hypothetical protein